VTELLLACGTAVWLGILTSISPCPLATNIAAISYIGRRAGKPRLVLAAGLGTLLVYSLLSAPVVSDILRRYMEQLLGPLLIIAGMFLTGLIPVKFGGAQLGKKMQGRIDRAGLWGALLLGLIFALSFCPTSAALFFMMLLPLAIERNSPVLLPLIYGIGTALPVVVFSVLIMLGANWVGRAYNKLTAVEKWLRLGTGIIFILVGIGYTLYFVFEMHFLLEWFI